MKLLEDTIYLGIEQDEIFSRDTTSIFLFPDHRVIVYPRIQEIIAKKEVMCVFSGSRIIRYIKYDPLIWDKTANEAYVLNNAWKLDLSYEGYLPSTIFQIEHMQTMMDIGGATGSNLNDNGFCYQELSVNTSDGFHSLRKLRRGARPFKGK